MIIIKIVAILLVIITTLVLLRGITLLVFPTQSTTKETSSIERSKQQNKYMWLRIIFQFLAVVVLLIIMVLSR